MAEYIYEYKYGDGYASAGVKQKLVRCKECKYRYGDKDEPYCSRINPYSRRIRVEDEDFCSWGEKNGNNY